VELTSVLVSLTIARRNDDGRGSITGVEVKQMLESSLSFDGVLGDEAQFIEVGEVDIQGGERGVNVTSFLDGVRMQLAPEDTDVVTYGSDDLGNEGYPYGRPQYGVDDVIDDFGSTSSDVDDSARSRY